MKKDPCFQLVIFTGCLELSNVADEIHVADMFRIWWLSYRI